MKKLLSILVIIILVFLGIGLSLTSCDLSDNRGGESHGTGDTTAPSEISNLKITGLTSYRLSLAWTNPSDSDFSHIEISYTQVVDEEMGDVGELAVITSEKGAESGDFIVHPYPNTLNYFTIKTVDTSGNASVGIIQPIYMSFYEINVIHIEDSNPDTLYNALMSDTFQRQAYVILECDFDFTGVDWTPIVSFDGILMGNGHSIKNMSGNNALFDSIGAGAVYGLSLTNVNMVYNYGHFGILVANKNIGKIYYCSVQGQMEVSSKISLNAFDYDNVGFLVGNNQGTIAGCFTSGNIKASANDGIGIGGLVGINSGTILFCYSNTTVSGYTQVGGLIGANSGEVIMSYAFGNVSASYGIAGAFVGSSDDGYTYTNCYYDYHQSNSPAYGLKKIDFDDKTEFVGFDFIDIWDVDSSINNGKPYLRANQPK